MAIDIDSSRPSDGTNVLNSNFHPGKFQHLPREGSFVYSHHLGMRDIYITLMGPCCWARLGGCLAIRVGLGRSLTKG